MNGASFIQLIIESYKLRSDKPIKIYHDGANVVVDINGKTWMDITLDGCIEKIKQSMAINYLEQLQAQKISS